MVIKMRCTGYHVGDVVPLNMQAPAMNYGLLQQAQPCEPSEARHVYEFAVEDGLRGGYPADGCFVGRQFNSTPLTLAFRDRQPFEVGLTYDVTFTPTPVSCGLPD